MTGYQVIVVYLPSGNPSAVYLYPTEKVTEKQKESLIEYAFGDYIVLDQETLDSFGESGMNRDDYIKEEDCIKIKTKDGSYDLSPYRIDKLWVQQCG